MVNIGPSSKMMEISHLPSDAEGPGGSAPCDLRSAGPRSLRDPRRPRRLVSRGSRGWPAGRREVSFQSWSGFFIDFKYSGSMGIYSGFMGSIG